jgi:hypothetical protein
VQQFSRVSACRRVLNSHDAASRESRAFEAQRSLQSPTAQRGCRRANLQHAQGAADSGESHANDWQPLCQIVAPRCVVTFSTQSVRRATAPSRCAHSRQARRWLENVAIHGQRRGAGSNWSTPKRVARSPYSVCRASHGTSRPNPSVNARPNGRPPGPRGALVYSAPRGPGVLPSAPRYLER